MFLLLLPNIYPKLNIATAKLIIEIKLSVVSIQHHPLSLKVGGRKPSAEGTNRIPFAVTPWRKSGENSTLFAINPQKTMYKKAEMWEF